MPRGRKPKSLLQHQLDGTTPRPRVPINVDAITIGSELPPVMPVSVQDDPMQQAEWDRIIAAVPPDFYNALDSTTLAVYVQARAQLFRADAELVANGAVIEVEKVSKNGELYTVIEQNPWFSVWKSATETLLKCADRLGLAPGARSRLQLPSKNDKPESKFGGLLGQKRLPAP